MKLIFLLLVTIVFLAPHDVLSQRSPRKPKSPNSNSTYYKNSKYATEAKAMQRKRARNIAKAKREAALRVAPSPKYTGAVPDDFVWLFLWSLADTVETYNESDPYKAQNPYSSAYGTWQMTKGFWKKWCFAYCDSRKIPRQILDITNEINQRLIAHFAATEMYRKYKDGRTLEQTARLMSKEWYGGPGSINDNWYKVPNPTHNNISYKKYADRVIYKMKKILKGKTFEEQYLNNQQQNNIISEGGAS